MSFSCLLVPIMKLLRIVSIFSVWGVMFRSFGVKTMSPRSEVQVISLSKKFWV